MIDGLKEGINIGGSFVSGKYDTDDKNTSSRTGFHVRADLDKIFGKSMAPVLLGELVTGKDDLASSVAGMDKKVSGYYAQLSSRVHPKFELVARHGQYDSDEEQTDNKRTETSVGVVYHALDNFLLKAEYQTNGEEGANDTDNNYFGLQVVAHW